MKKTFIIITLLSVFGKIFGFFREMAMASNIGANVYTDVYTFAMTTTGLLTTIILTGLNTAFIPVLADAEEKGEKTVFFNRLTSLLILALVATQVLVIIFAKPLMSVVAPGLDTAYRGIAIAYSRILSINILTISLQSLVVGYLQKHNRFLFSASIAIPSNIILIVGIMLSSPNNITPLVISTVVGHFASLLWLMIPMMKLNVRWHWDGSFFKDEHIKVFFSIALPILLSLGVTQINVVVDRSLSSLLPAGSASYLNYASKIQGIFYAIVIVSFTTVLFPKQSELASQKNYKAIFKLTSDNMSFLLLLIFPITAGLMFLSQEVAQVIYMRNQFTLLDAQITGKISFFYTGIILFQAISDMIAKMFFSMKETKKPMISTLIGVFSNIVLNLILIRIWGIYGLAIATLLSVVIRMGILIIMAQPYFTRENIPLFKLSVLKIVMATATMIGGIWVLSVYTPLKEISTIPYILAIAMVGAVIYFLMLFILKTDELVHLIKLTKSKLVKKAKM